MRVVVHYVHVRPGQRVILLVQGTEVVAKSSSAEPFGK